MLHDFVISLILKDIFYVSYYIDSHYCLALSIGKKHRASIFIYLPPHENAIIIGFSSEARFSSMGMTARRAMAS